VNIKPVVSQNDIVDDICGELIMARMRIVELAERREFKLALTKIQEAEMWLQQSKML
jgi:hypothetical protein